MALLQESGDWNRFIGRAIDDLLGELGEQATRRYTGLGARQVDIESAAVRERLAAFAVTLLAAAGAGTGTIQCDDGNTTVDCSFVLRPNEPPYYRCLGHAPPHCYDAGHQTIGCP